MLRLLAYLWTAPNTLLLGGPMILLALASGGQVRRHSGVIEVSGGRVARVLERVPILGGAAAMTLGHVVIARCPATHDATRSHERVHVRQYERWGPLFVPAYFGSSFIAFLRRRDPYRDNAFEREAYELDGRG